MKKHFFRNLFGIIFLAVCIVCLNNNSNIVKADTNGYYGRLFVNGNTITDSLGNNVQLKGISTHGINWFPEYVNEDCFRQLHNQFGANVIRLAMYTSEYNGYCTGGNQEELKNLIRDGVRYATENNMYFIVDWHILSDNNPNIYIEQAKQFFNEMSAEFADHENVLYEICNEPNGGTSWSDIKSYAEQIIPIIRANDENAIIIVGTPNWSQYVNEAATNPITRYSNIMYSLHFYAATHTDYLRDTMESALNNGLPIFVTEYGICDSSGNGGIDYYQSQQWIDIMNKYNVSYCMWSLSNKSETSAIINNWCNKTSDFTTDDLSASGHWLLNVLTGSDELKDRVMPDGLNCDSNGVWNYYINGVVDTSYNGMAENEYGWWKITNGTVDFNYNGLAENEYGWWKLTNGTVDFNYNGLAENEYGWWKITNGTVDFNYNGLAENEYGWWKITNGTVDFNYNGLAENEYGWWKLTNGTVDFNYNGMAENEYGWWKLTNGTVDFNYNGLAENEYGWWKITNGIVDFSYNGLASNQYGTWNVVNGHVVE